MRGIQEVETIHSSAEAGRAEVEFPDVFKYPGSAASSSRRLNLPPLLPSRSIFTSFPPPFPFLSSDLAKEGFKSWIHSSSRMTKKYRKRERSAVALQSDTCLTFDQGRNLGQVFRQHVFNVWVNADRPMPVNVFLH